MTVVNIRGEKYCIIREITPRNIWPKGDVRNKFRFYEAKGNTGNRSPFLANYGKYWGVGENYYDSSEALESAMFAGNRETFMQIIDSDVTQQKIFAKSKDIAKTLPLLFPLLDAIKSSKDPRYRPSPDDKIINVLSEYKTVADKRAKYNAALDKHEVAITDSNTTIPLGASGAEFNDVDFIFGHWCVQKPFCKKTTIVARDNKEFFVIRKLPRQEHTNFDFYTANPIENGMFGEYVDKSSEYVIAKKGEHIAYGKTIADARAYLSIKLYDVFQDVIENQGKVQNGPQK